LRVALLRRFIPFELSHFYLYAFIQQRIFLYLDSSKVGLKRDVPRVLVTSDSRRESPVRNSSVPGALSESSGLRASAVASLSLSLSLSLVDVREAATSSTSVFYPPAFQRPTYLRASCARMYVHIHHSPLSLFLPRFIDDNC